MESGSRRQTPSLPSHSSIRGELDRLVNGPLGSSPQLGRFLRYVVEEELAGRSEQLKEQTVAIHGLGRAPTFDPGSDASVRVAARQLRFKLAEYYGGVDIPGEATIELPKGAYVPAFSARGIPSPAATVVDVPSALDAAPSVQAPPVSTKFSTSRSTWLRVTAVVAIALALVSGVTSLNQRERANVAPVIAVLPFTNLTGLPDDAIISDGLSDEITSTLARDTSTRVIARTSAWKFREQNIDVRDVGRQLGASHVIEGSIRKAGDRYRVSVQINSATDGVKVWAEQYDVDRTGAFALYDRIAESVHLAIGNRIAPASAARVARAPRDPSVSQLLVEGRSFWSQRTDLSMRRAVQLLTTATRKDSTYAPAWAALAGIYATMEANHVTAPGRSAALAMQAAERALSIDPSMGEAWAAIGLMRGFHEWRWAASDSAFHRAITLAPNYPTARSWYSNVLLARGDVDGSLVQLERAHRIDPLSMPVAYGVAQSYYYGKRWNEGLVAIERAIALGPGNKWAVLLKAKLLKGASRTIEARQLFAQLGDTIELALLDRSRQKTEILRLLAKLTDDEKNRSQFWIATLYAQIGWPDSAFVWLERAYAARQSDLSSILVDPMIDPVKDDARYRSLVGRLGLGPTLAERRN